MSMGYLTLPVKYHERSLASQSPSDRAGELSEDGSSSQNIVDTAMACKLNNVDVKQATINKSTCQILEGLACAAC